MQHSVRYVLAGKCKLVHMRLQLCGTKMDQIRGKKKEERDESV